MQIPARYPLRQAFRGVIRDCIAWRAQIAAAYNAEFARKRAAKAAEEAYAAMVDLVEDLVESADQKQARRPARLQLASIALSPSMSACALHASSLGVPLLMC
jgi:hypothetical protein